MNEFHERLSAKLKEEYDGRVRHVVSGLSDYPTYRESVGYLAGLTAAQKLADEVIKETTEG